MSARIWLTSMSGPNNLDNAREMIEPIAPYLDGVIWVLHDSPVDDPGARYLESVKGDGRVIHRSWPARHWFSMCETLFTGLIEEDDLVIWTDPLERPAAAFLSRVQSEIAPMMREADVSVLFYYGKPYLFRYSETLEYRQSPHWTLTGYTGRAIEWSQIEPDESKVRLNVRPQKRLDPFGYVTHYARYYVAYPAGSNTCALGLDHWPPGDRNAQFAQRETRRLAFRRLMKARGVPLTTEGLTTLLAGPLDGTLKDFLRGDKVLSDFYHHVICCRTDVKDSHNPADALPIP